MRGMSRDEQFFARPEAMGRSEQLDLHVPFDKHDQLIHVMDIILPHLTGWIDPHPSVKSAGLPFCLNLLDINRMTIHDDMTGPFRASWLTRVRFSSIAPHWSPIGAQSSNDAQLSA